MVTITDKLWRGDNPAHPERHNLEITPIRNDREYHVYCSFGDLNVTCRTYEAAKAQVWEHAIKDARLQNNSEVT